ncbi:uncharacterized protein EV154DRAFT_76798 [Mucor mucedo]|uniref:uncharacterized protein n=1 Tax=Mucor mucedo TaxID=29922 RepID=UPI00221F6956|nr:uncharacterized protein EV154DRAFT_76798 [Mucor mucedo]KAI7875548.1 hypothetical protein EV154DRAFT_76798 [Mucor mucedo]
MVKYLLDLNLANKELEQYDLTIAMVVTDYLRGFHELAMTKLKETERFKGVKQEMMSYCMICPSALQAFINKCFIKAELIKENEPRLHFTTKINGSDIDAVHFAQHIIKPTRRNSTDILFRKKKDAAKPFALILGIGKLENRLTRFCFLRIIIDFGTTLSGCSYSRLDNPKLIKTIKSGWYVFHCLMI